MNIFFYVDYETSCLVKIIQNYTAGIFAVSEFRNGGISDNVFVKDIKSFK